MGLTDSLKRWRPLACLFVLLLPLSAGELTSPQFEQAAVKLTLLTQEDHGWWYLNERGGKFCVELDIPEWRGVRKVLIPCEREATLAVKQAVRFEEDSR